jgi:uncharacterized protein YpmB
MIIMLIWIAVALVVARCFEKMLKQYNEDA